MTELAHGTRKSSISSHQDVVSSLPENVIANIMDHLPIEDAVRTSILARNWRYKWTLLSRLVFYDNFCGYLLGSEKHFHGTDISRLLLHLKGDITKFVLPLNDCKINAEDINHWILFLSRKGIKEFTLVNFQDELLKLPTHLFSCLDLKHLSLYNVSLHPSPTFRGFPNLLSLDLSLFRLHSYKCEELLAHCPLLEDLSIFDQESRSYVKLAEIAKLENLKTLSLSSCLLDNRKIITSSSFFEHFSLLPKLQELSVNFGWHKFFWEADTKKRPPIVFSRLKALTLCQIDFRTCEFLAEISAERRVSTTFPCLETLTFFQIDFRWDLMVSCAFGMIFGSPNLQNLHISVATCKKAVPPPTVGSTKAHDTMGQLQLQNVTFVSFRGSGNEVRLIKDILACSVLLKKVEIYPSPSLAFDGDDGKYMFARKLLKLHRASPIVEVNLH